MGKTFTLQGFTGLLASAKAKTLFGYLA